MGKDIERVSTGIPFLDKITEGGFLKDSVNLLVGVSGSGKTIFSTQFLMEGIKNKEKVLFISFEDKKEELFRDMIKFGWNLEEEEKKGNFFFIFYAPEKLKTMIEEGGGFIENIVLSKKITRIVIENLASFVFLFKDLSQERSAVVQLFNIMRKWGSTNLLTYEKDPLDKKGLIDVVEFEADSVLLIYSVREKMERKKYFEILKMRGTNHSKKTYSMEIEKRGISILDKPIIGKLAKN